MLDIDPNEYLPDSELILWVGGPIIITFSLIWLATCLAPAHIKVIKQTKNNTTLLVRKDSGHPFFVRTGLLDGGTPYMKSWSTNVIANYHYSNDLQHHGYFKSDSSSSALQKSVFTGWYNIAMLLILSYIVLNFCGNYNTFGTLISNTSFLWSLVLELHQLLIIILLVYFASFSVFFTQYFSVCFSKPLLDIIDKNNHNTTTKALITRTKWIRLYFTFCSYMCILCILTATSLFVFHRTTHWPFTQKMSLMLETICLVFKSHSYFDTNNELFALKLKDKQDIAHADNKTAADNCKLSDITIVQDIDALSDVQIRSYLIAYGLKRDTIYVTNIKEQKKFVSKLREQLVLRNTIYPNNVCLWDFLLFSCSPTLCYSPIYPRTNHGNAVDSLHTKLRGTIDWVYVIEKCIMACGLVVCMYLVTENAVVPILTVCDSIPYVDGVLRLYFPFFMLFILGFYVVFDCILNTAAELTCFADRQFYSDWWNATSFMEFSRKWNVPVHEYLLRHIYLGCFVKRMKCSKTMAKIFTFIFSIVFHELVLMTITHRFKPWFTFFSLWQIPLMPVMASPMFKNTILGNLLTMASVILGTAMIAVLYAKDYSVYL